MSLHKLADGLVNKCRFLKFPREQADFDEAKGVEFLEGSWGDTPIQRLTIYSNGILLDTRESSATTERILEEALIWAADEFGLKYTPASIMRKRYLSQVLVTSDAPILGPSIPIRNLAKRVSEEVGEIIGEPFVYEPSRLDLDFERHQKQTPLAFFTIQRLAGFPFSDGKYYSESALPTEKHFAALEKYEAEVLAAGF